MKLRPLPAIKVIKALENFGFKAIRKKGSHVILRNDEGVTIVIPVHSGEELGKGILMKIIRQAGLTRDEFLRAIEHNSK